MQSSTFPNFINEAEMRSNTYLWYKISMFAYGAHMAADFSLCFPACAHVLLYLSLDNRQTSEPLRKCHTSANQESFQLNFHFNLSFYFFFLLPILAFGVQNIPDSESIKNMRADCFQSAQFSFIKIHSIDEKTSINLSLDKEETM